MDCKCVFIEKNRGPLLIKCNHDKKYGDYCYKHRKFYLIKDGIINKNIFTNRYQDYTSKDIIDTLKIIDISWNSNYFKLKKKELYDKLINIYDYENILLKNINKIKKIQSNIRRYIINYNIKYRGIGFYCRHLCKNDEDFFYMTNPLETDHKLFFSYKDNSNSVWFFDIRSLSKIIESTKSNPYTRDTIPDEIIYKANYIINKLNKENINTQVETYSHANKEDIVRQKTIDLFSNICQSGYYCDIEWFLSLNIYQVKKLYRKLEDIWNFRAWLTPDIKSHISPPNGLVYNIPIPEILNNNDILDVKDIILNETMKFNNAVTNEDKKLGYMYFLIGLSEISYPCLQAHEWIQFAL
jgi:hypothetical protein